MKKQRLIIKIIFILFAILPSVLIFEPIDIVRDIILWFFGFYFLINIFLYLKKKNLKYARYILNILDGFIMLGSIAMVIMLIFFALGNEGEGAFIFFMFPILGILLVFGVMSMYFTNSK